MLTSILLAMTIQATPACDCPYADVPIVGHRGSGNSTASNPFAENTVPSVRNAYEEGAEWAEVDVHLTADNVVVAHHDFTLGHTVHDREGCIVDKPWSALEDADATKNSGAEPGSARIPTLDEVLEVALEMDRKVMVELKVDMPGSCDIDYEALVDETVAVIRDEGATEHVMLISFSFEALEYAWTVAPELPLGFLALDPAMADAAVDAGFTSVNPHFATLVGPENATLAELKEKDILVIPWTVNGADHMATLLQGGVDGLITDEVALALSVRQEQCEQYVCPAMPEVEATGGCATAPQGAAPVLPVLAAFAWLFLRRRAPEA